MNPWAALIEPPQPADWRGARTVHALADEPPAHAPEAAPPAPEFVPWALLRADQAPAPGPYWPLLGTR